MNICKRQSLSSLACPLLMAGWLLPGTVVTGTLLLGTLLLGTLLPGTVAHAEEIRWDQETIRTVLQEEVQQARKLARSAVVVTKVEEHNALPLSLTSIRQRDRAWIEGGPDAAAKQQLLQTPLNQFIQQLLESRSEVTEIFIADRQGALVAAYPLTSDYWQGDEEKWSRIMVDGWDSYVGLMSFDDSTRLNSVQVSVPVSRGDEVIGVLVMGFKLSHVLARQLRHIGD